LRLSRGHLGLGQVRVSSGWLSGGPLEAGGLPTVGTGTVAVALAAVSHILTAVMAAWYSEAGVTAVKGIGESGTSAAPGTG